MRVQGRHPGTFKKNLIYAIWQHFSLLQYQNVVAAGGFEGHKYTGSQRNFPTFAVRLLDHCDKLRVRLAATAEIDFCVEPVYDCFTLACDL